MKCVLNRNAVKVDESAAAYYIRRTMRLLLLLSAFLTAMVGVGTPAAAAVRPACEVSVSTIVRAERLSPQLPSIAPLRRGALDRVNFGPLGPVIAPVRAVPLYAERLRV